MNSRLVTLKFHEAGWLVETRPAALVTLEKGQRVSEAIAAGADTFGAQAMFAWVKRIPAGAEEFTEIPVGETVVTLMQASWVPQGCVVVGRGGQAVVSRTSAESEPTRQTTGDDVNVEVLDA